MLGNTLCTFTEIQSETVTYIHYTMAFKIVISCSSSASSLCYEKYYKNINNETTTRAQIENSVLLASLENDLYSSGLPIAVKIFLISPLKFCIPSSKYFCLLASFFSLSRLDPDLLSDTSTKHIQYHTDYTNLNDFLPKIWQTILKIFIILVILILTPFITELMVSFYGYHLLHYTFSKCCT